MNERSHSGSKRAGLAGGRGGTGEAGAAEMDEERLTIGVETCMITSSAEAPCGGRIGRRSER